MKKNRFYIFRIISRPYLPWVIIAYMLVNSGCRKLIEVEAPFTSTSSENAYSTDATAIAVITGIYAKMSQGGYSFETGTNGLSVIAGLSSDELSLASGTSSLLNRFYTNSLTSQDGNPWNGLYNCLLTINSAIEKLSSSNSLSPSVKQQLFGEAKFLRAFCYFYLVNLYGDVPVLLKSDYRVNASLSRLPKIEVYGQIIDDLKEAQNYLSDSYLDGTLLNTTAERIRPTKWAATALLARVYLYTGDWANAETQATSVINNNSVFKLSEPNKAFIKASLGNKEAIWQLQPVNSTWNTEDARVFVLTVAPGQSKPVFLDTLLVKSFEPGDLRRNIWIKDTVFSGKRYSYSFKYKIAISDPTVTKASALTEYLMVLRLAEQFLIRAEARAQQNKLLDGIADLDEIRKRSNLSLITTINPGISKGELLTAILHERQVELFTEWAHRWLDLKRTNAIDTVMSVVTPLKGGVWNSNMALYPIPSNDLLQNLNLTQNQGY